MDPDGQSALGGVGACGELGGRGGRGGEGSGVLCIGVGLGGEYGRLKWDDERGEDEGGLGGGGEGEEMEGGRGKQRAVAIDSVRFSG